MEKKTIRVYETQSKDTICSTGKLLAGVSLEVGQYASEVGQCQRWLLCFDTRSSGIFCDHGQIQVIEPKGPSFDAVWHFGVLTPPLGPQIYLHMSCYLKKHLFQPSHYGWINQNWDLHVCRQEARASSRKLTVGTHLDIGHFFLIFPDFLNYGNHCKWEKKKKRRNSEGTQSFTYLPTEEYPSLTTG